MDEKWPNGFRLKMDGCGWRAIRRRPFAGEYFLGDGRVPLLEAPDRSIAPGECFILEPIYADDPAPAGMVQVKRELIERLRKAYDELYAAHLGGAGDDALRRLANVVSVCAHEIVVAVPPPAPATRFKVGDAVHAGRCAGVVTSVSLDENGKPFYFVEWSGKCDAYHDGNLFSADEVAEARRAGGAK